MLGNTNLTITGNLTANPKSGVAGNGATWARFRVASSTRVFNPDEKSWRDGDTIFLDVVCFRRLAENVVATLQRGDRVLVSGRVKQRSFQDEQGARRTLTELEADSIGPDLARYSARLSRPRAFHDATGGDEDAAAPTAQPALVAPAQPDAAVA